VLITNAKPKTAEVKVFRIIDAHSNVEKEMTAVLAGQPSVDSTGWRPVLVNSVAGVLRRFACGIVETQVRAHDQGSDQEADGMP
jgi:hypothetical protein